MYCLTLNLWLEVAWVKSTISSSHFHIVCQSCFILLLVQFEQVEFFFLLIRCRMKLFLILKYWTRDFIAASHVKRYSASHSAFDRKRKEKGLWHSEISFSVCVCVCCNVKSVYAGLNLCVVFLCTVCWLSEQLCWNITHLYFFGAVMIPAQSVF